MDFVPSEYREAERLMEQFSRLFREREDIWDQPFSKFDVNKYDALDEQLRNLRAKGMAIVQAAFGQSVYMESTCNDKDNLGEYRVSIEDLTRELRKCESHSLTIPRDLLERWGVDLKFSRLYDGWENLLTHYRHAIASELQRRAQPEVQPPPKTPDIVNETRNRINQRVETLATLTADCDEQLQKFPDHERAIRTAYRKAMDRLKEEL